MSYAVDANILIYASDDGSPFREPARTFLEGVVRGPEIVYLFWPVVMAYLRISTRPGIFQRPLAIRDALTNVEQLLGPPHVKSPGEQDGFWARYRGVIQGAAAPGRLVPDAHLVALMVQNDVDTIWSHDRDFRRFPSIRVRDPIEEALAP